MKLTKRSETILFICISGTLMSLGISFVMTSINYGFGSLFFKVWTKSWLIGTVVAIPLSRIISKVVRRVMRQFIRIK